MAASDLKALTHINIPFVDERYAPGDTIPRSVFEAAYEDHAPNLLMPNPNDENATPVPTVDDVIAELIEGGSLSEDMDAPIHPDNLIPDPNRLSLTSLQAQAEVMIAELQDIGHPVPKELRDLVNMQDRKLSSAEEALSDERIS